MRPKITSLQNPRVKQAVKLRRAGERLAQGRMVIDGLREIERAITCQIALEELFYCPTASRAEDADAVARRAEAAGAIVHEVSSAVFSKLAFGDRNEGLIAVGPTPERTLDALQPPAGSVVAVVEGVEKPGNFGAILRSADAAGVGAVIAADAATDLFNPAAIRASLGTIFSLPIAAGTTEETLEWLRGQSLRIVAARLDEAEDYRRCDLRPPLAIVLGGEARGLSRQWYAPDIGGVRLPMHGIADSLNVASTASVLFYESLRRATEDL